jgi:hypothetical protein
MSTYPIVICDFTEDDHAAGVVTTSNRLKALVAVLRYWRTNPQHEWLLVADRTSRSVGPGRIEVLHPTQAYLDAGVPDPTAAPNSYSTPLFVEWANARVVLGADLPVAQWSRVLADSRTPALSDHTALKVSHHGSTNAQAPELVDAAFATARVAITPWNLGRRMLPQFSATGGVHWLLARRAGVSLTASGRVLTTRLPQAISLSGFEKAVERRTLPGEGVMEVRADYDPDESWVAFTFDGSGRLTDERYGRESRRITR